MSKSTKENSPLRLAFLLSLALHLLVILVIDVNEFHREPISPLEIRFEPLVAKAEVQKPAPPKKKKAPLPSPVEEVQKTDLEEDLLPPKEETPPTAATASLPSEEVRRRQSAYLRKIRQRILREQIYPREARKNGWEGTAKVRFVLGSDGNLLKITILESSSHESLDKAAIEAIKKASPFAAPPTNLFARNTSFTLPVLFELR